LTAKVALWSEHFDVGSENGATHQAPRWHPESGACGILGAPSFRQVFDIERVIELVAFTCSLRPNAYGFRYPIVAFQGHFDAFS
jgi:hypothetical protein